MAKKGQAIDRMTAEQYKDVMRRNQKIEDGIHTQIANWLTVNLDGFFQTVENSNRGVGIYAMIQQKLLKARGAKKGFPDIVIWYQGNSWARTLCLEVKAPGEHARPEQVAIHTLLAERGCPTEVVRCVAETEAVLKKHGVPLKS